MSVSLSIKEVPDALAEQLRARAERNHRSLQRELMTIIEAAVQEPSERKTPAASEPAPSPDADAVVASGPNADAALITAATAHATLATTPAITSSAESSTSDGLLAALDAIVAGSRWGQSHLLSREQAHDRRPFETLDPRFSRLVFANVHVEILHTGCRWAEGPAWFAAGRYLVWSDIPNDRMLRWDETDGSVSVFRQPANNTNGHTVDLQGRLVSCEHRGRCVSRTEHDGTRTVLASHVDGRRLNSPNDVVVKSDGSIWFTDPSYGIDSDYEGDAAASEIGACSVYRIGADGGPARLAASGFVQPNGLAFSPDESQLYIADTGASHVPNGPRHIRRYSVGADGFSLSGGEVYAESTCGLFDGFRFDSKGNLWTSASDGVHCYAPDGQLIGKIRLPEAVANVCFGGAKLNRLFICATTSLYAVYLNARAAPRPAVAGLA